MSTQMFWAGLLSAVSLALITDVACLIYLSRPRTLPPPDYAVVNMLKRIAIYEALPMAWMAGYFVLRLLTAGPPENQPTFYVGLASVGYAGALLGLALPAISAAVLTHTRDVGSGQSRSQSSTQGGP